MRFVGMDEVGYGALAGPLLTVAVSLEIDATLEEQREGKWWPVAGVKDSKKLSAAQRDNVFPRLMEYLADAKAEVGFGDVSAQFIDDRGYSKALSASKVQAFLGATQDYKADVLIMDGSIAAPLKFVRQFVIPKADQYFWLVAAASIIAKVTRDATLRELAKEYPMYDWHNNMGYAGGGIATSKHIAAIKKFGLSPHHRVQACRTALSKC